MIAKKKEIVKKETNGELSQDVVSSLVLNGDLSKLSPPQKVQYYNTICERIGVDPATQPFKLLKLGGKEVLYADKGCAQQLCKIYHISTEILEKKSWGDVLVVTVRAKDDKGRFTDEDGAVTTGNLKGDALANAIMKAVTKAKRRAVLALCGLGMLDETEIETIPNIETKPAIEMPREKNGDGTDSANTMQSTQDNVHETNTDEIDEDTTHPINAPEISEEGIREIIELAKKNGYNKEDYKKYIATLGYSSSTEILIQDISTIISYFNIPKKEREEAQQEYGEGWE